MIEPRLKKILRPVWAKSPVPPCKEGVSLIDHTEYVIEQTASFINLYYQEFPTSAEIDLKRVLLYAALIHDFGKIHPRFQEQLRGGSPFGFRHEILSLAFLKPLQVPEREAGYLAAAVVLHHKDWRALKEGSEKSPSYFQPGLPLEEHHPLHEISSELPENQVDALLQLIANAGEYFDKATGIPVRPYEFKPASLNKSEEMACAIFESLEKVDKLVNSFEQRGGRGRPTTVNNGVIFSGILTRGLIVSADHLASAEPIPLNCGFSGVEDVLSALRFKTEMLMPHQLAAENTDGNAVLIAPTGTGKTESALLWAGRQRENTGIKGRCYFLLPYRASMNAMADRLAGVFGSGSVAVIHGKSLNRIYETLLDRGYSPEDAVKVARHQEGLARLNTAPIRVCSPYQLIRSFFGQKGYEANLCSTLDGQLIFDEIHAYDTMVTAMTLVAAGYLCERLNARVLFMSATMPQHLKNLLQSIFPSLDGPICPPENWLDSIARHRFILKPYHVLSEDAVKEIKKAANCGSVLVVVNQVKRAVKLMELLRRDCTGQVVLLHSRFCQRDRREKEKTLNPEPGQILIATQVVEVSLDIDYDTGFFELAPLESLLQRCGRVNRRGLKPPMPVNIFTEFDEPLKKAAQPYEAEHLEQVKNVLMDFIASRTDGIWRESDTHKFLNASYPDFLKEDLFKEWRNKAEEFSNCFVKTLRPFGLKDISELKQIREQWDNLFDGYEVLPQVLLDKALEFSNPLEVSQLLVPISGRQVNLLRKSGKLVWNNDLKEYVANCYYDKNLGLKI